MPSKCMLHVSQVSDSCVIPRAASQSWRGADAAGPPIFPSHLQQTLVVLPTRPAELDCPVLSVAQSPYNPYENMGTGWTFDHADGGAFRGAMHEALFTYRWAPHSGLRCLSCGLAGCSDLPPAAPSIGRVLPTSEADRRLSSVCSGEDADCETSLIPAGITGTRSAASSSATWRRTSAGTMRPSNMRRSWLLRSTSGRITVHTISTGWPGL